MHPLSTTPLPDSDVATLDSFRRGSAALYGIDLEHEKESPVGAMSTLGSREGWPGVIVHGEAFQTG